MSYIGNTPFTAAFQTDTFSGNGSTVAFTMSVAPANTTSIIVAVTGVVQDPSTYSVSGTTLTFSAAPPTGTSNISVRFLGIPASGVTTTAYRTVTDSTATAGQTTFSIPSYTVGYINVFRNGSLLAGSDYTATSGTTVVLANAASAGDTITTESFYVSSVLNALPTTGGTLSGQLTVNSATGQKPLIAQVNGTEVFEVDASGNVGIGTNSPAAKLQVAGAVYIGANNYFTDISGGYWASGNGTFTTGWYTQSDGAMSFRAGGSTERMRIDSSGNLLVGTTSNSIGATNNILCNGSIYSGLPTTSGYNNITAAGLEGGSGRVIVNHVNGFSAGTLYAGFGYNGGGIGSITQNGTTAVAYNTTSDYRLKENVQPLAGALSRIATLKPCTYTWKSAPDEIGEGFIAHELAEVCPQAVTGEKDAVNEDGSIKPQSIDTSFLVATLTAAIQEMKAIIDTQASTITQLQADVAALKGNA